MPTAPPGFPGALSLAVPAPAERSGLRIQDPRTAIIAFAKNAVYGAAVELVGLARCTTWSVLATMAGMPAGYRPYGYSRPIR